jgi:hypothetical protein
MFTIYIDDSGSAPEHRLAIASGIIFPAKRLEALEKEWQSFLDKEEITEFHSSVCMAHNPHTEFALWDDDRVRRVFARVRQITFKYSVDAFCIAIHKKDYDEVVPKDMFDRVGSHFTWAVSSVIGHAYDWGVEHSVPMEYVFDNAEKRIRREIDDAMEFCEAQTPGYFAGHYFFRKREEVPALQAADLFAWTCFQRGRHVRFNHPIHSIAEESWEAYERQKNGQWCEVQSLHRQGLEDWVKRTYLSPVDVRVKEFKEGLKEARKPKPKGK